MLLAFGKFDNYLECPQKLFENNAIVKIEKSTMISQISNYETIIIRHPIINEFCSIEENTFKNFNNLKILKINPVDSISIKSNAFCNLSNLIQLDLSLFQYQYLSTNFSQTNQQTININLDSFAGLINLKGLTFRSFKFECLINNIFNSLSKLETLRFESCTIDKIEEKAFDGIENLFQLCLNGCYFNENDLIAFKNLKEIQSLEISNIKLGQLKNVEYERKLNQFVQVFKNLKHLRSCDNNLKIIINEKIINDYITVNLQSLCIDINSKPSITRQKPLKYQQVLPHYHTKIIDNLNNDIFKNLKNLEILEIKSNGLFEIESYSFKNLHNLKKLNLSHNSICVLKQYAFYGLGKLVEIDLSMNNIEIIDKDAFNGCNLNLENLSLLHNPIKINDLTEFIIKHDFNQNINIKFDKYSLTSNYFKFKN